jgi:hypothetical protein
MISPGKPCNLTEAVLVNPAKKISGYAGVQNTRAVREDVDIEACWHFERMTTTIN